MIPFNKPFLIGSEIQYIEDAVRSGKISGNGKYTKMCQQFFEQEYGFKKALLTSSCTDALEMAAILADIKEGDEVIIPSYTFVSTALAFVRQGAKIVFADSYSDNPNIDATKIERLITPKTKAIVPVHYAGVACDMDLIMDLADKYNLLVIEDAAQAIDSFYIGKDGVKRALGSIGHMAAFSFHETKNIICGEGGMLVTRDAALAQRASGPTRKLVTLVVQTADIDVSGDEAVAGNAVLPVDRPTVPEIPGAAIEPSDLLAQTPSEPEALNPDAIAAAISGEPTVTAEIDPNVSALAPSTTTTPLPVARSHAAGRLMPPTGSLKCH